MPPEIALSLYLAFIAACLLADSRRSHRFSLALWVPTIWMMYCGSRPLAYWFNPGLPTAPHADYTEGSEVDRMFLSVLIIVGLSILWRRGLSWSRILNNNRWAAAFFTYMAVSIIWSDYPGVSSKRWVRTAGDLIMALLVLTEPDSLDAIKTTLRRSAFALLPLSIVLIKYFPAIGREYSQDGSATMWI